MSMHRFVRPFVATEAALVAGVVLVGGYLRLLQHLEFPLLRALLLLGSALLLHSTLFVLASALLIRFVERSGRREEERERWLALPAQLSLLAAGTWLTCTVPVALLARKAGATPDLLQHLLITLPLIPGGLAAATAFFEFEHAARLLVEETLSTHMLGSAVRRIRTRLITLLVSVAVLPMVVVGASLWHVLRDHGADTAESAPHSYEDAAGSRQDHDLSHQHTTVLEILLSVGAAAAGAAVVFGVYAARSLAHPVLRLTRGMARIRDGALDTRVPVATRDELGAATEAFNGMAEGLAERDWLRDSFGRYVSRDVAEALRAGRIAVGGEMRIVTVLFCDVRGFTQMSEDLPPAKVLEFVNDYVRAMSEVVARHHGRVDKVIGDGLLVVFGAPLEDPEHGANAIRTALGMREALARMNEARAAAGKAAVRIGIGIHSGEVIAGNVGLESHKVEYTILGDTVNVASRIEGLTKDLATDILVSEHTIAATSSPVQTVAMPDVTLRGRTSPIRVFGLAR